MPLVIDESPSELVTVGLDQIAITVSLTIDEVAGISGPIDVVHGTSTRDLILIELTDIPLPIVPNKFALAMSLVRTWEHLPLVPIAVGVRLLNLVKHLLLFFIDHMLVRGA